MKSLVFVFSTLLSIVIFANEKVVFKADMLLQKCVLFPNRGYCLIPPSKNKEIEVILSAPQPDNTPSGIYRMKAEQDGVIFGGTIRVTTMTVQNVTSYLFQVSIESMVKNRADTYKVEYLGSAFIENLDQMSQITWSGSPQKIRDVTVTPKILVASRFKDLL